MYAMTNEEAELMTAEEVGVVLRLKAPTVYEAAADGRIPCVRLWKGRRKALVRFRREDIDRLIRDRRVPGEPEK
jgi:excisionase family DNA binding protein